MSNTKIVLNRQSDLILDNANITAPVGIVVADIAGLESAILSIDTAESAHMSAEVSSRISGDASLAAKLSYETSERIKKDADEAVERSNAVDSIMIELSSEESSRIAGDASLASNLSSEESSRIAGDASLAADLSAEESARIVAETSLQNNIDAESSINLVRDQAEESRAIAAETSLAADLDAEQSRAESAEASLNAKVENVISNVDPAALDSLTEIVGAFQSADGDLNGAITALSSTATAAVDNEASIRLAADQSLAGDLSSEIADREAAVSLEEAARISGDASLALDLSSEIAARISDVDAEETRAMSAEASLGVLVSSQISTEHSHHVSAEASIDSRLSSESSTRLAADNSIAAGLSSELVARASAVSSEASSRLSADNSIAAGLSSELVARASGDASIAAGLSSELVARASGDASLAATLSAANSSIEAMPYTDGTTIIVDAATNTIQLKTEVAAPSGGTRTFSGLINVAAQPASLAGFGDLTLVTKAYVSGQVSSEASTRLAADNSIAAGLSSELVARASADTAEASTRLAADNSIAAGLSSELVARASADTSIAANLSTEKSRIDAILLASDADKDSFAEIVSLINSVDTTNDQAFASYVLSNDAALSTELVARASADSSLATQISSELSTANASIEGALSSEISRAQSVEDTKLDLAGGTMSGGIDMGNNGIGNVTIIETAEIGSPNAADILVGNNFDFGNTVKIVNLAAPTNDGDATNKLYVDSADQSLATALSSEISRAEAAEDSLEVALSTEVSYLLANTDLTSIDSFAEVSDALAAQVSDFTAIYFKKASFSGSINGTNADFTLADAVRSGSETVYLNGLLQEAGVEYTVAGSVITFATAPSTGDKVVIYGVY